MQMIYITTILMCGFNENYKHLSILSLHMTIDGIGIRNLVYNIHIIKRSYNLDPTTGVHGRFLKNDTQKGISFSVV